MWFLPGSDACRQKSAYPHGAKGRSGGGFECKVESSGFLGAEVRVLDFNVSRRLLYYLKGNNSN